MRLYLDRERTFSVFKYDTDELAYTSDSSNKIQFFLGTTTNLNTSTNGFKKNGKRRYVKNRTGDKFYITSQLKK